MTVRSGFVNDTWRLNNNFSFNLGVRYDRNHAVDAGGAVTSTSDAFSPRLAATWDMKGDGKLRVTANYAKYVAGIQEGQAGSGYTPAGAPASYYWYYDGFGATPINTGAGPYLTSEQALNQLWGWFRANGCLSDTNFMQPILRGLQDPSGRGPERSRRQPADPGLPRFAGRGGVHLRPRRYDRHEGQLPRGRRPPDVLRLL